MQQMTFFFGYKNVELLFAGLLINTPGGKIIQLHLYKLLAYAEINQFDFMKMTVNKSGY